MACPICGIELPDNHEDFLPCGVAPRYYVNEWGFICGVIGGCPYEPPRTPNYLPHDIIPRVKDAIREKIELRAKELVNAQSYKDLWSARYGKNDHLNFNPKNRLGIWSAANSGSLYNPYKSGVRRSKIKGL